MPKLPGAIESARRAFARLNQQEQFLVLAGGGGLFLILLIVLVLAVSSAITRAENRVKVKTDQLTRILQMQGEYRARVAEKESRLKELDKSKVRLVSLVEDVARQAGVEIGQLRPEDSEPTPEGIIESRVDLKASNLSADRLQDFLQRLEDAPGVVVVRRLKVNKPYRRETLDLELTVTTFKRKET
jgi:Na+-transporting methylmalonyl-CoA/oxaloacetate decarboxylase gamma subunit